MLALRPHAGLGGHVRRQPGAATRSAPARPGLAVRRLPRLFGELEEPRSSHAAQAQLGRTTNE
eukprot:2673995-Prorocentrum_lima.AAC.1